MAIRCWNASPMPPAAARMFPSKSPKWPMHLLQFRKSCVASTRFLINLLASFPTAAIAASKFSPWVRRAYECAAAAAITLLRNKVLMAGYSGTPLAKKLGIKEQFRVALLDLPVDVKGELACCQIAKDKPVDFAMIFVKTANELKKQFPKFAKQL